MTCIHATRENGVVDLGLGRGLLEASRKPCKAKDKHRIHQKSTLAKSQKKGSSDVSSKSRIISWFAKRQLK